MASESSSGGGFIPFIVGALVVVVAVFGYFLYSGQGKSRSVDLNVHVPNITEGAKPAAPAAPAAPAPEAPPAPAAQ